MHENIGVLGLGYVGLPLLVALAGRFDDVVGFDIDTRRIAALQKGEDWTGEVPSAQLTAKKFHFTTYADDLKDCSFFIVTVPTPIDNTKCPDLRPLLGACQTLGTLLRDRSKSTIVPLIVFESTVYPGLTEEMCGTKIAEVSGLIQGTDFRLGYSPERINPGDHKNRLETITKIISAEDVDSLARMEKVYGAIITAPLHRAASIRVAEAAKVIENTQRDINIALMNELAIICDKLDIRTHDVLEAAGTKWNFLKFTPGLVGGHCIGVDPYYLTTRAEELGYHPQVILAGRRINDNMSSFIAQKIVKLLNDGGALRHKAHVGILGLAFKENVRDLRNSRVPEIVRELESFGIEVVLHDPLADPDHARHEYGLELHGREALTDMDALVLAVPHTELLERLPELWASIRPQGWFVDIKSIFSPTTMPQHVRYWSL
jgi:UDP-N-acetyl-D-galactosamine dehydrogenase